MRRYHIRAGATTTAGGIVRASSSFMKVDGAALALEGDEVDCPACGTVGLIQVVAPRIPEIFNGKQYALSDDLCICKCNPPPKLVTDQTLKFQTLAVAAVESAEEAAMRAVSANTNADELVPIRLIDAATGWPHANRAYRLELTGKVLEGVTDADGLTKPLSETERNALVAWSVPASR